MALALDEMYVKVNGEMRYLWRAVDHEGEILESYVTKERVGSTRSYSLARGASIARRSLGAVRAKYRPAR